MLVQCPNPTLMWGDMHWSSIHCPNDTCGNLVPRPIVATRHWLVLGYVNGVQLPQHMLRLHHPLWFRVCLRTSDVGLGMGCPETHSKSRLGKLYGSAHTCTTHKLIPKWWLGWLGQEHNGERNMGRCFGVQDVDRICRENQQVLRCNIPKQVHLVRKKQK